MVVQGLAQTPSCFIFSLFLRGALVHLMGLVGGACMMMHSLWIKVVLRWGVAVVVAARVETLPAPVVTQAVVAQPTMSIEK